MQNDMCILQSASSVLCRMYGCEEVCTAPDDIVPNYTYDADTGLIF